MKVCLIIRPPFCLTIFGRKESGKTDGRRRWSHRWHWKYRHLVGEWRILKDDRERRRPHNLIALVFHLYNMEWRRCWDVSTNCEMEMYLPRSSLGRWIAASLFPTFDISIWICYPLTLRPHHYSDRFQPPSTTYVSNWPYQFLNFRFRVGQTWTHQAMPDAKRTDEGLSHLP